MAQQTSYYNNPPAAINGLVEGLEGNLIWTKIAEGVVSIGLLAAPGTNSLTVPAQSTLTADGHSPGQIKDLVTASDPVLDSEFWGVPIFDSAMMQGDQITTQTTGTFSVSAYKDKQTVPFLRKGRIWVLSENAVTQDADVYVRTTAAANNPVGQFSMTAGANKAKFPRGRWLMSTSGAGLAKLEVW